MYEDQDEEYTIPLRRSRSLREHDPKVAEHSMQPGPRMPVPPARRAISLVGVAMLPNTSIQCSQFMNEREREREREREMVAFGTAVPVAKPTIMLSPTVTREAHTMMSRECRCCCCRCYCCTYTET